MFLQGPIVVIAESRPGGLVPAFTEAGAFPVIETTWADAPAAIAALRPGAIVIADPDAPSPHLIEALALEIAQAEPILPVICRVRGDDAPLLPGALPIAEDAQVDRLVSRLAGALRLRALHSTVLRRAASLKTERGVVADLPDGDPLDDATALVIGRGKSHPILTLAIGERMGVIGALSVEAVARCVQARDIDGIVIGEGLGPRAIEMLLQALAEDGRFRDLPVAALGPGPSGDALPNFIRAAEPHDLVERLTPLIQLHAFEARLKRTLASIERMGMLDPHTGLLHAEAFDHDLALAIEDSARRGDRLSIARFAFADASDRRSSLDVARLLGRLMRDVDFACRHPDGSILAVFTQTDLRAAHVVARRLAAVLRNMMLRPDRSREASFPDVTLATMRPSDTLASLTARVCEPVAAVRATA